MFLLSLVFLQYINMYDFQQKRQYFVLNQSALVKCCCSSFYTVYIVQTGSLKQEIQSYNFILTPLSSLCSHLFVTLRKSDNCN